MSIIFNGEEIKDVVWKSGVDKEIDKVVYFPDDEIVFEKKKTLIQFNKDFPYKTENFNRDEHGLNKTISGDSQRGKTKTCISTIFDINTSGFNKLKIYGFISSYANYGSCSCKLYIKNNTTGLYIHENTILSINNEAEHIIYNEEIDVENSDDINIEFRLSSYNGSSEISWHSIIKNMVYSIILLKEDK